LQITRVELRNIKNHAEAEWDFFPGLIAICGPNGSGKTTILEAIAWALFDQLDYKREDFVRRGQVKGQVAVSFISDLDEREYIVHRETNGPYYCTDAVTKARLVEQRNQVLPWLCLHIGVEPGTDLALLFRSTIGVPQGTFTHDFARRPADRKRVFDHTLRVDEYSDAADRLRQTVKYVDDEAATARLSIASAEGELRIYDQTQLDLARANEREHRLATSHEAASAEQIRLTSEIGELDDLRLQLETQRNAAETLELKLRLTRDQLASAMEAAEQARAAATLVAHAREAHDRYLAASERLNELEQLRSARDRIRHDVALLERRQIALNSQRVYHENMIAQVEASRTQLPDIDQGIRQQEELEHRIAALREARGARESDRREIERLDRELKALRGQYAEAARELAHCEEQRPLIEKLPDLQREHLEVRAILSSKDALNQSIELREGQAHALRREAERLLEEQKQRDSAIAELDGLRDTAAKVGMRSAVLRGETARLARLRAEIERDVAMIDGLESGGICPLLSEKCLNLDPGDSLDGRFRENVARRREEVVALEQVVAQLDAEIHLAQEAAARIRTLPSLVSESDRVREVIRHNRELAETIQQEVRGGVAALAEQVTYATNRLPSIQVELTEAQLAYERFQQAEPLRRTIQALTERGTELGRERAERSARISGSVDSDATLTQEENKLKSIGDPRSRRGEIERQMTQAAAWAAKLDELSAEVRVVDADMTKVSAGLDAFATLERELEETKSARTANEGNYRTFIANQQTASTLARREEDLTRFTSEIAETEHALNVIKESLISTSQRYDAERHIEVRSKLDQCTHLTIRLSTQLDQTREDARQLSNLLKRLEDVRAAMTASQAKYDKLQKLSQTTDFIRSTLLQAAPFITEAYLFSISHEANQLYREISGRQDITLSWTRDYEIMLEEEGQKRPFGNLSGGEQMAAALAFRLALLKELSEINIAFFDEPTANLDEDRRRNLAQQIGRIKHFRQLFVVSHDDSFEAYTDQVIMLTEKIAIESSPDAS
jgi:DNA repair protein SbcC/Rad50